MAEGAPGSDATATGDLERRFAALVNAHRERTRRLAWRLLGGDDAAAEDVAQEAFVKAWRALGRFRGEASLSTWLYRIVVHEAHRHRRWRAVRERWGGLFSEQASGEAPDPAPEATGDPALRERIARALAKLSRRQREVFVLVHLEGFTVRESAEILGSAPGTLKSHLHRALVSLRRELADLAEGGRAAYAADAADAAERGRGGTAPAGVPPASPGVGPAAAGGGPET